MCDKYMQLCKYAMYLYAQNLKKEKLVEITARIKRTEFRIKLVQTSNSRH